jgi:hypothetical protein
LIARDGATTKKAALAGGLSTVVGSYSDQIDAFHGTMLSRYPVLVFSI